MVDLYANFDLLDIIMSLKSPPLDNLASMDDDQRGVQTIGRGTQTPVIACSQVRRSTRRTKAALKEEFLQDMKHYLETDTDRVGELAVRYFPKKGRGIVAMRDFRMGEFVAEYTGILLTKKQAKEKEEVYGEEEGSFMYYFKYNGQIKCIDATARSNRIARLINHSRSKANLAPKIIELNGKPRLLLFAKSNIPTGTEVLYDYGDRCKETIEAFPWLAV